MITTHVAVVFVWMNLIVFDTILLVPSQSLFTSSGQVQSITTCSSRSLCKITDCASLSQVYLVHFVTAFNLQLKCQERDFSVRRFMQGKMKLMNALCPAWAHSYLPGCRPDQQTLELNLPQSQKVILYASYLLLCGCWRLFTDGAGKMKGVSRLRPQKTKFACN